VIDTAETYLTLDAIGEALQTVATQRALEVHPLDLLQVRFEVEARRRDGLDRRRAARRRLAQVRRQAVGGQLGRLFEGHAPLHDVLQLAHVAGPAVGHEEAHRISMDRAHRTAHPFGEAVHELLGQDRHVLGALAQRR